MIFFIAPSGGNNSYICMKLINKETGSTTTYHGEGSHSNKKEIINKISLQKFNEYIDDTTQINNQYKYDNKDTAILKYILKFFNNLYLLWLLDNHQ